MKEHIKKGDHIGTIAGELIIKDFNGNFVDCDEYEVNMEDELFFACERRLTLSEIGHIMKELDGQNHTVIWGE